MRGGMILISAMLLSLSVGVASAAESSPRAETPLTSLAVCDELLAQAQQVGRLLRSVSDRESADNAADELRRALGKMQRLCRRLELAPVENSEEARELAASMRSLTHVFQGYMPVVERLMEVNAYGSEKLVNVFHLYKVHEGYRADSDRQDSPRLEAYQEWADAVEFVLYHVRKLRTADAAAELMPSIRQAGQRAETCRKAAEAEAGAGDSEALQSVRKLLETLRMELQSERIRLRDAGLLNAELADLLDHCY